MFTAATPWSVPAVFHATSHLAMTEPPSLTGPAMSAYLDEVRSLNCGDKPDIASVQSATLFSPFALLFGFRPSASPQSDFRSSAEIGIPGLGNEWTGSLTAFCGRDDSFFLRPGDVRERTFVANIGLALLAAGHTPNMSLAWDRVKDNDLRRFYLTAEEEVRKTRVNGNVNGRGSHGTERSRFDLLGMECEHCGTAQAKRLEGLCSLVVGPPQGPRSLGYSFEFPKYAQDPRWKWRADLCAEILAAGAARLIELDHDYASLNASIPRNDKMTIVTRQFGDAWLAGIEAFFNPPHLPAGQKWAPPAIRIGEAPAILLIHHQFQHSPDDRYVGRFAVAHRLDLRPGFRILDLHASLHGEEMREAFNYTAPGGR